MTAQEFVSQIKDLPSLSPVVVKLIGMLNNLDTANDAVVQIVRHDPTLTARLLSLCNSAKRAGRRTIASVDEAVFRLGRGEIMKAVIELGVGQTLQRPLDGYAVEGMMLWRHSLATAMMAEALAEQAPSPQPEAASAFTAGLLHDIGKVVLNQVLTPEVQADVRQRIQAGDCSWVEAERAVIGVDHAAVGAQLLDHWELPASLVEAVAHHHEPDGRAPLKLSATVHVADCLAHMSGCTAGWSSYAQRADESIAMALGLSAENVERFLIRVPEQLAVIEQSPHS